jgi:hypothetical protein
MTVSQIHPELVGPRMHLSDLGKKTTHEENVPGLNLDYFGLSATPPDKRSCGCRVFPSDLY